MKYRVGWAKANLKKAGLVDAPCRGVYAITEQGIDYLEAMAWYCDSEDYLSEVFRKELKQLWVWAKAHELYYSGFFIPPY